MSKNPDYDDKDLIHEPGTGDSLGDIHSHLITPDITQINEDAAELKREKEVEPDKL